MIRLLGESPRYFLFTDGSNAVIIDRRTNMVDSVGNETSLAASAQWNEPTDEPTVATFVDLAAGALADLQVHVTVASARMYTIPKAAQEEAKRALEWRKEYDRGGTPVGLNTARTLARGGQIGIEKVRHIAKYFPRHEVDKKGKGYKPGQDGFPSNGRIAWALWGGDSAWKWAAQIVERENKKTVRADGYVVESDGSTYDDYVEPRSYDADVNVFEIAKSYAEDDGIEFVARTREDGSGIDRLYMVSQSGQVFVWDDGTWDDLASTDGDIYTHDRSLDDPYDVSEKRHILIDPDTALILSAYLQSAPFSCVTLSDLNAEESELVASAAEEIDWTLIDALVAAPTGINSEDGKYTPEERSQKARKQVRDANGKFASQGSRVVVDGDGSKRGSIVKINPNSQSVVVKLDSGEQTEVAATATQKEETFTPQAQEVPSSVTPLDTSGILGQPRATTNRPNAVIPNGLPALTPDQLGQMLSDFPAWVKSQRDKQQVYTPPKNAGKGYAKEYAKDLKKKTGVNFDENLGDLRDHPLYKNLFKKKPIYNLYYNPILSAAATTTTTTTTATTSQVNEELTPKTSDVQPLYMAIVSPEDPSAVFDLIAVVPASTTSTSPMTYVRRNGEWTKDEQVLADLTSPTPPPVVPLSGDNLIDVLQQLDKAVTASVSNSQSIEPLVAKGGLDRNRGNAEKLRHYWLFGRGALKIRWNTPGDWTRCYRHLAKYMGPRAKGYCSLRHKEATGVWPGSKYNIGKKNKRGIRGAGALFEIEIPTEDSVIETAKLRARTESARRRVLTAAGAYEINGSKDSEGGRFFIPLVIPEGVESGDGRKFRKGSLEIRDLPLPLLWQLKTGDGHDGSVVVGRIDRMGRTDHGIGNAYGVFDTSAYGKEAERLVRDGFIRGVSADLDRFEASEDEVDEEAAKSKKKKIGGGKIDIDKARVMAVTIVPKPAFQECRIILEEDTTLDRPQEDKMNKVPDGIYVEEMDDVDAQSIVACGMIAGSIPVTPPAAWFENPQLTAPTPLTVDDSGRVFGHIASWNVDHIGMVAGTKPPRSKSKYSYFHTGLVRADNGNDYPVGQLTLAGGHASLSATAVEAARHYDDTGSAIADVRAGEDAYGIWVAGALRPSASPEQIRALRASAPSGDWRPINGALELVAVCQVNVPGFPIARARVASGQVYALVAAGAQVLARMKTDPMTELAQRIETLEAREKAELAQKVQGARDLVKSVKQERLQELSSKAAELATRVHGDRKAVIEAAEAIKARVASAKTEMTAEADADAYFAMIPMKTRQRLAKTGKALPDGSYPIRNVDDLRNAIQAYGRSKPSKRAEVKRHIMKRARVLDKTDLIPENWKK